MNGHILAKSLGTIGGAGLGPLAQNTGNGASGLANLISAVIGMMTVAAGIWFIFMFLIGGYSWMTSMGEKQKLEEARNRIVYALIGLVIVVAAWGITNLAGQFLGISFLDIESLIGQIK